MPDLNLVLVISLAVLAFFSFCFFVLMVPIAIQLSRTLNSAQCLLDTINEFEGDVKDIKQNISKVRNVVSKSTELVKSNLQDVSVAVVSSVHGVLTGIKDYFSNYKSNESGYNGRRG